ncbi:helix-turn-helix domain-containing protein [Nakamurella sp. YIM 132087]|uniref:Helix-turn-helix domain-containing protein n=1 Tax=Nakamurella alba TaxID=2665158 RepID=A0A7K1FIT7_9ACTN|nr:helix-turn-helix domain-containing protein [Nakamurella alba]MTD13986.1 helix-turn-helix domain-containing protein [Nakamurella alba]
MTSPADPPNEDPVRREQAAGGSLTLAALRQERDLSQSALSVRSGIAIRTVRNLERGGSSRPRLATVQRVFDVLRPDASAREDIVRELGLDRRSHWFEPRRLFRISAAIDEAAARVEPILRKYRTVYYRRHVTVRHRRVVSETFRTVIVATEPHVDTIAGVIDTESVEAACRLQVRPFEGCSDLSAEPVRGESLVLVRLCLPRPLREGEAHEYAIVYSDPLAVDGDAGSRFVGLHTPVPAAVLQVGFDGTDPPAWVRNATREVPSAHPALDRPVGLDPAGEATRTLTEPDPGWHGLAWGWSRPAPTGHSSSW